VSSAAGLGLLGLGLKAGTVVVGTTGVRAALRRGDLALIVLASDLSQRTEEKVARLAHGTGIPVLVGPSARELGLRLGRDEIQAVGVRDPRLADGLRDCWSGREPQGEEQKTG
jgi:ribosomal protein L7Ae-like RNA K-turn-binding protein